MNRKFAAFVSKNISVKPLLPAAHTMDGWRFRSATAAFGIDLDPKPCDVYKECITYLFYGRPAYRGHSKDKSVSLNSFYLVSFILEIKSLPPLKRLMPFDTGAFQGGIFASSMHPKMTLHDFELPAEIDVAGKIVSRFFGKNISYWFGHPRNGVGPFGFSFEAECYMQLISSKPPSDEDDRRSAIELQIDQRIDFKNTRLLAIVMPECFADEPEVSELITRTKAEPITYECYHSRKNEDARSIMDRTFAFLKERGMI